MGAETGAQQGKQGRIELKNCSGQHVPFPGRRGRALSSLLRPGMPWVGDRQGGQTRFAHFEVGSQKPQLSACPCRLQNGWAGWCTYRTGGEPCITPEDDTCGTQGGTFTNGGDEIHLCGEGLVTGEDRARREDRQGGQAQTCSALLTPWPSPPLLTPRQRLLFHFLLKCLSHFHPHVGSPLPKPRAHESLGCICQDGQNA